PSTPPTPLQSYRDSRPLPAFPTRRSSDLEDRPLVAVPLDLRLRSKLAELSVVRACKPHPVHFLGLETLVVLLSPTGARTRLRSRDRKSTRLNSSHVKISYAVFCLKKKKTQ